MLYKKFTRCKNLSMWLFFSLSRRSIELSVLIRLSVHFVCPMCFVIRLIGQGFASLFGIRDPTQSLWMRIDKRVETAKKKKSSSSSVLPHPPIQPTFFHQSLIHIIATVLVYLFVCVFNDISFVYRKYCVECVDNAEIFWRNSSRLFLCCCPITWIGSWRNPQKHRIKTVVLHAENWSRDFGNMWLSEMSARISVFFAFCLTS